MTRPARNVQALVSISLEGLVPGDDETINDAVARWVDGRINLDRHVAAGVDAVYTDGEGFLDDFFAGDVPMPGIYTDDRHEELGSLVPVAPPVTHCESDGSGTCLVHFGRLEDTDGSEGPDVCDLSPEYVAP